jgi:hypothetical protein
MKDWHLRELNNRTFCDSTPPKQKAPQKVLFIKWCAIVCDYRTENYDEYKSLKKQITIYKKVIYNDL